MPRRRIFNPLTELLAAALLVVLVLVINRWQFSLAVLVAVILPAVLLSGRPRRIGLTLTVVAAPLLLSSLVLHGLFFPEGTTVLAQWGFARMTVEGLEFAALMGLRMAVFAGALLTATMTASIPELVSTMTHRGWNRKLVFVIGSAVGLLPHVAARAHHILRAQQARGLVVGGGLRRFKALLMVSTPLVTGLLVDASERTHMLEARGFSSTVRRTSYLPDTDSAAQRAARWAMTGVVVVFSFLWLATGAAK
ncbi:energy-coupling factor transporter transmembrane component T [Arthrobacter sp. Br18]|uniref:energy-coupling factor transporter transmembrane component T family protein n=1 Tax=Arthrobacter sp. Br18 TaxID=1312954 RepID=UPI0004B2CDDA|nr:energy-coupling factor transporter transmembrane component T [Arthrobacter sp. Br18]